MLNKLKWAGFGVIILALVILVLKVTNALTFFSFGFLVGTCLGIYLGIKGGKLYCRAN